MQPTMEETLTHEGYEHIVRTPDEDVELAWQLTTTGSFAGELDDTDLSAIPEIILAGFATLAPVAIKRYGGRKRKWTEVEVVLSCANAEKTESGELWLHLRVRRQVDNAKLRKLLLIYIAQGAIHELHMIVTSEEIDEDEADRFARALTRLEELTHPQKRARLLEVKPDQFAYQIIRPIIEEPATVDDIHEELAKVGLLVEEIGAEPEQLDEQVFGLDGILEDDTQEEEPELVAA